MRIWWQQQHSYHQDSVNEMLRRGVSDCLLSAHTLMKQLYFQDCISFLVDREKERERVVEDKPIIVQRLTPACILLRHSVSPSSVSSLCNWISSNTRVNSEQTERERERYKKRRRWRVRKQKGGRINDAAKKQETRIVKTRQVKVRQERQQSVGVTPLPSAAPSAAVRHH